MHLAELVSKANFIIKTRIIKTGEAVKAHKISNVATIQLGQPHIKTK